MTSHLSTNFRRRGMTLIELLVAIAVIIVIAALSIPVVGRVREQSQVTGCLARLKQLGIASFTYAAEHQGLLPRGDIVETWGYVQWPYVIDRYLGFDYLHLLQSPQSFRQSPFSCPAQQGNPTYNYAQNRQLNERLFGDASFIRISQILNPSRYVLFADSYYDRTIFTDSRSKMLTMTRLTQRHGGTPNFLYADGHVAPYKGPIYGVSDPEGRNDPAIRALWEYNYRMP